MRFSMITMNDFSPNILLFTAIAFLVHFDLANDSVIYQTLITLKTW